MLRYFERAVDFLGERDAEVVVADPRTFFALSYAVQIVGEAASRVSEAGRALLPGTPWRQIVGIRHHLVHGYEDIDAGILVGTVRQDLPPLIASLRSLLADETQ
ncbi:MAG: HepT-like ribonuclease domain-containing protein [Propylenella sp.]